MAGHSYLVVSLLLLITVVQIHALMVCPPNACHTVRCAGVSESSCKEAETFVPKGGYCGCCSACLMKITKGNICTSPLMGIPPTAACENGTTCSKKVGDNVVCD